ncbi:thiamine pyrophosphate-dependent dehydrogenase E1 component subunit alpha [uncultured Helcococcus sp.]|uniref:thiamine pyrophosphate-dependent dehydrogenase E1 component subunit alpha n=1 Tax=uncultured Helcococcus sp. TaxID=1072508 RepID=UPI00262FF47E|nr:thiamine pyrophosphate-dependent dehydrogenase E1 component subunit alpha [uncultured Helcococcus sp.]
MGKYSDKLTKEQKLDMLRLMEEIRHFDLELSKLYSRGLVAGMTHYSVGEEAANVGAIYAMRKEDLMYSNHRGHGQTISKGIDLKRMMAEILGKAPGYCKGRGGSMHVFNLEVNNMSCNGIVGGGHGLSVGAALVQKMKKTGNIVLAAMGDGATNEGSFHEGLNMASTWNLPLVWYVINNKYGISMDINDAMNVDNVVDRAPAYGIPGILVEDGNDILAVYDATMEAIEHARSGKGPVLVESKTYRWFGHSASDAGAYRSREEIDSWRERDPIEAFRKVLLEDKTATEEELDEIREKAVADIKEAVKFAKEAPYPEVEVAFQDNFAD